MKIVNTINDALYELGVVDVTEEPSPEDSAYAVRTLNRIMDGYNTQSLVIPYSKLIIYDINEWTSPDIKITQAIQHKFKRDTTATYIEAGILKYAAIDEKRFEDGQVLMEDAATNYVLHSEDLTQPTYAKEQTSFKLTYATAADNIRQVPMLIENDEAASKVHGIYPMHTPTLDAYAVSFKVNKINSSRNAYIRFYDPVLDNKHVVHFDLEAMKPWEGNDPGLITASVRELANGWLECKAEYAGLVALEVFFGISNESYEEQYPGTLAGLWFDSLQIESTTVSSYIPTHENIVTRAKDQEVPQLPTTISPHVVDVTTDKEAVHYDYIYAQPPTVIDQVFFRDNTIEPVDYMLTPMTDREYAQRAYKGYKGIPTKYYISYNTPSGTHISFNAVPQDGLKLVIIGKEAYKTDFSPMDDVQWGTGVERMLMLRLAIELAPSYHIEPSPVTVGKAMEAENTVKAFNYQPKTISSDIGLLKNRGRGRYNPARI